MMATERSPGHSSLVVLVVFAVFVIIWFLVLPLNPPLNPDDIAIEGIYLGAALASLLLINRLRVWILSLGWSLFTCGLLIDFLDEFTREPDLISTTIEGIVTSVGLIITAYGFYTVYVKVTRNERRFASLFSGMNEGMAIHETIYDGVRAVDYRILDVNPMFESLLGLERDDVVGRTATDVYGTEDAPFIDIYTKTTETGEPSRFESYVEPLGRYFRISVFSPEPGKFATVFSDITQRTQTEKALKRATEKINLLNQITRHDILNQVMVVQGYLEMLESEAPIDGEAAEYLDRASKAAQLIEQQITFTSDYQSLGMSSPRWQDPGPLVRSCISAEVHRDDVETIVDLPSVEIFADPMLERAFCNLIQNAEWHGGGITRLVIRGWVQDGDLSIVVEDDGCGIDPGEKENLFEASIGTHHGLGLYLISEILGITGISIIENGTPGEGARFEITVPGECWRRKKEAHS